MRAWTIRIAILLAIFAAVFFVAPSGSARLPALATQSVRAAAPAQLLYRVNTFRKVIALTFDAGSDRGYTQSILDTLTRNHIHATFGLTGVWAEHYPTMTRRINARGMQIANHTYDHASFTGYSTGAKPLSDLQRRQEIERANSVIRRLTGHGTKPFFRPPYGDYDSRALTLAASLGYRYTLMWTVDSLGWKGVPAQQVAQRCVSQAVPGAIILMHVGEQSTDAAALPTVIAKLRARGFNFVTVSQLVSLSPSVAHASHTAINPPRLAARAAFILDDTDGHSIYAYHADSLRYPASTVKMMTALVVLQHLSPATVVTVPPDAMRPGTTANLVPGERMTVASLLYGLLLPSGNDAAVTLADAVAGSPSAFSVLMNAEARRLHLRHSRFLGATGLDAANQYMSARDLAWLAHELLRHPRLAQIVRTKTYRATSTDGRHVHYWTNRNRLLWMYPGTIGVKTGTTPLAGANLIASATRGPKRIIAVLLGSTDVARFDDGIALLNYGWQKLGSGATSHAKNASLSFATSRKGDVA